MDAINSDLIDSKDSYYKYTTLLMLPFNRKFSVSLDHVMSIKSAATVQEYLSQIKFPLKDTPFEHSIAANEKVN